MHGSRLLLLLNGPPASGTNYQVYPSGGVLAGGVSIPTQANSVAPSGGILLGGVSDASSGNTFTVTPSGGIILGGGLARLLDSFTDTSGTALDSHPSDGGGTWIIHPQSAITPVVSNANKARGNGSGTNLAIHTLRPPSPDYSVTADYSNPGGSSGLGGVGVRVDATAFSGYFVLYDILVDVYRFRRYDAGTATLLATSADGGVGKIKIQAVGSKFWAYKDGTLILGPITDSTYPAAGSVALYFSTGSNTAGVHVDNLMGPWNGEFVVAPSGGVLLGGVVTAGGNTAHTHSPSGGVLAGGTSSPALSLHGIPSGGVLAGAVAALTASLSASPSGGVLASSSPAVTAAFLPSPSGGILLAAQGIFGATAHTHSPSGGVLAGGQALPNLVLTAQPSGGVVAGGGPSPTASYAPSPSGGILGGGQGFVLNSQYTHAPSGGVLAGAQPARSAQFRPKPSGGLLLSGSPTLGGFVHSHVVSGGVLLSGVPVLGYQNLTYSPSGGILAAGRPAYTTEYKAAPSGGALLGGQVTVGGAALYHSPSGGILASAVASLSSQFRPVTTGGVLASATPSVLAAFSHVVAGGVLVGGAGLQSGLEYRIYANAGDGGPVDYTEIVDTTDDLTWTSGPLSAPGIYRFGVRVADLSTGLEEENLDCVIYLKLDASSSDVSREPDPPAGLTATPTAAGGVLVEWTGVSTDPARAPTGYRVYAGPWPSPDYGSPAATVPASQALAGQYRAQLSGYANGAELAIAVRAYNPTGEEANAAVVKVVADTSGPNSVGNLVATTTASDS